MQTASLRDFLPSGRAAFAIPEVCQISGLGRSTIYKDMAEGKLRVRRRGHRTLILATDLVDYLEAL